MRRSVFALVVVALVGFWSGGVVASGGISFIASTLGSTEKTKTKKDKTGTTETGTTEETTAPTSTAETTGPTTTETTATTTTGPSTTTEPSTTTDPGTTGTTKTEKTTTTPTEPTPTTTAETTTSSTTASTTTTTTPDPATTGGTTESSGDPPPPPPPASGARPAKSSGTPTAAPPPSLSVLAPPAKSISAGAAPAQPVWRGAATRAKTVRVRWSANGTLRVLSAAAVAAPRVAGDRHQRARARTIVRLTLGRAVRVRLLVRGPAPACRVAGAVVVQGRRGLNEVAFGGRVAGRPLGAGFYALQPQIGSTRASRRPRGVLVSVSRRGTRPIQRLPLSVHWRCGGLRAGWDRPATALVTHATVNRSAGTASRAAHLSRAALVGNGVAAAKYDHLEGRKLAGPAFFRQLRLHDPGSPATILMLALFGLSALLLSASRLHGFGRWREEFYGAVAAPPWRSTMSAAGLLVLLAAVTMVVLAYLPLF